MFHLFFVIEWYVIVAFPSLVHMLDESYHTYYIKPIESYYDAGVKDLGHIVFCTCTCVFARTGVHVTKLYVGFNFRTCKH